MATEGDTLQAQASTPQQTASEEATLGQPSIPQQAEGADEPQPQGLQQAEREDESQPQGPQQAEREDESQPQGPQQAEREDESQPQGPQQAEREDEIQPQGPQQAEREDEIQPQGQRDDESGLEGTEESSQAPQKEAVSQQQGNTEPAGVVRDNLVVALSPKTGQSEVIAGFTIGGSESTEPAEPAQGSESTSPKLPVEGSVSTEPSEPAGSSECTGPVQEGSGDAVVGESSSRKSSTTAPTLSLQEVGQVLQVSGFVVSDCPGDCVCVCAE